MKDRALSRLGFELLLRFFSFGSIVELKRIVLFIVWVDQLLIELRVYARTVAFRGYASIGNRWGCRQHEA